MRSAGLRGSRQRVETPEEGEADGLTGAGPARVGSVGSSKGRNPGTRPSWPSANGGRPESEFASSMALTTEANAVPQVSKRRTVNFIDEAPQDGESGSPTRSSRPGPNPCGTRDTLQALSVR